MLNNLLIRLGMLVATPVVVLFMVLVSLIVVLICAISCLAAIIAILIGVPLGAITMSDAELLKTLEKAREKPKKC